MSKIYLKKIVSESININLTNINIKRREYLEKLSGKSKYVSYLSWLLLKEVVQEEYNLNIDELQLYYNKYNKPYFKEFCFNISHSHNIIAIAISSLAVGIDIERINSNISLKSLGRKINANSDDIEDVIKRFSLLEAYYKKIGTGLKMSLLKENIHITKQDVLNVDNDKYILSVDADDELIESLSWRN